MKRFISVFLAVILLLGLSVPTLGDVAFEPNDNFYERHRSECRYENRNYYTNGVDGFVLVYASPVGEVRDALPNGVCIRVYYTYDDGTWGQTEYLNDASGDGGTRSSGWIRMSDMVADYDSSAFYAEHAGEFSMKEATLRPLPGSVIYGYKYPGSGIVIDELDGAWAMDDLYFKEIFTDPAGREWGQVGYYYGHRDFWVCLDDPFNGTLDPDENYHEVRTVPAASAEAAADALRAAKSPTLYLYAGAAALVILAGAVLIVALRRKNHAK